MTAARRIGFLGAGQMATALAHGWTAAGLLDPTKATASDPIGPARDRFATATGITTVSANDQVVSASDVIVLAVKPQTMDAVLAELKPKLKPRHLIVSIAAGVTVARLTAALGANARVVRVMPNTPCLVGATAAGYAAGPGATAEDRDIVAQLFGAVGEAFELTESLLDAVTGLSGSGPAFVYVMIEALADGGVRMGLPREVAQRLAAQTVYGSAKMVLETDSHPAALKDAVASPGGTTIAGLHALERGGLRATLMDAVEAATLRSRELGSRDAR